MAHVREVVRLRKPSRVPDEVPPFRGLLSLRGEIVTVLELAGLHILSLSHGAPTRLDTTGVTTGSIRPSRIDSVVVLRGGHDPLGLEVDGVEDIRDFATRPETPGPAPAPAPAAAPPASESTGTTAPAPGRMWAGIVKDERGEIGVLDTEAVFEMVAALAKKGEEPQALEVGDIG